MTYPAPCNDNAPELSPEREYVIDYFQKCPEKELRQVYHITLGSHGGSAHSMLQKYSLGGRIPERYQLFIANTVVSMYDMCIDADLIPNHKPYAPDLQSVREAGSLIANKGKETSH